MTKCLFSLRTLALPILLQSLVRLLFDLLKPLTNSFFTEIIKRLRALTLKLLPLQVDPESLTDPTSRIITPKVIAAYSKAAGDYGECVR